MQIKKAEFIISNPDVKNLPPAHKPEYAFIGRSNVGKSSLINMLTNHKNLAKISSAPGKTRLINHFLINDSWYLVDLPGYGYAKVSKQKRNEFKKIISDYLKNRQNLVNVFLLIDVRHEPQRSDLEFMEWLGVNKIPFSIVFTKLDKLSANQAAKNIRKYQQKLLQRWESLPKIFKTSSVSKVGRKEILDYIEQLNEMLKDRF
jgi:GTP-binding protein